MKKKPQKPNKPNLPKFNLNWLFFLIAMMLLGLLITNPGNSLTKEVSYDEFQEYIRNGYVEKVIGYDDNSVEAFIKQNSVAQVFPKDSNQVGKNPMIITESPSRDKLSEFIDNESEKNNFDGTINYDKKRDYFGALL